jgi:hypothetical protein
MTSWCWLAVVDEARNDATAVAELRDHATGEHAGWLAAWCRRAKPARHALRADSRIVDPDGDPATISLVLAPREWRLKFDDPAVAQARRDVLARRPPDAVSTLLFDASHFAGAITVRRGTHASDPFARIVPARVLDVAAGVVGRVALPCGPTIERHGSENPWPWPAFSE